MFVLKIVFLCLFATIWAKNEFYKGHKVYEIMITYQEQQEKIHILKNDSVDFWKKPSFRYKIPGLAMVPESLTEWFEEKLHEIGIPKKVHIEDVYGFLEENERELKRTLKNVGNRIFGFDAYYRYSEIVEHLHNLHDTHPETIEVVESDVTELNNTLHYLKISASSFADVTKPIIIVEAGVNPREWITVPAAINIINQLQDDDNLLQNADWIVIPLLNPDGYEYTHTNDRFWEKTRTNNSQFGEICPGVNVNRNFDINWSVSGSSMSPCSNLYAGVEPFSETESRFIKNLLEEYGDRIGMYFSIQNNGPFVTFPWRHERAATGLFRQHFFLARDMINAMTYPSSYHFDVGSYAFEERASGTSSDYAQRNGVLYSLNIDIPQAENGFMIPEDDIEPIVQDAWRAIRVAATDLISRKIKTD